MSNRMRLGTRVQIATNVTATPLATADMVSIEAILAHLRARPTDAVLQIVRHGSGADTTLPAGSRLLGVCDGRRVSLGTLNSGNAIVVGDAYGWQDLVRGVLLCSALLVLPGGALGGASPAYDAFVIAVRGEES